MSQESKNIAVLGAGIMGLSAAYALRQYGHNITIYDPAGFPANNASYIAGGMLAPYSEIEHMDHNWVEAGLAGIEAWRALGLATGFEQNGSLLIAHEEDRHILERFKSHLPDNLQRKTSPQGIEPQLPAKFQTGIHLTEEAHLIPDAAMSALCNTLEVRGASLQPSGYKPDELPGLYDHIIDCRGMGANDPHLRGVKGETLIVHNSDFTLSRPVRLMHPRYPLYIVPRADNIFMIGATNIESSDNTVTLRSAMELMSALYSLHPSFGEAEIIDIHAGVRPSYSDNLPRITVTGNTISCNGLYRHGYLLAPIMAQSVVDYVAGKTHKYWPLLTKGDTHDHHDQRRAEKLRSAA